MPFSSFGCTYTFSINPTHCFINKAPGSGNENTPSHLSTGERQHIVIAMQRRVPTREQSACRYAAVLPKKEPKPVSDSLSTLIILLSKISRPASVCIHWTPGIGVQAVDFVPVFMGGDIVYYKKWQLCKRILLVVACDLSHSLVLRGKLLTRARPKNSKTVFIFYFCLFNTIETMQTPGAARMFQILSAIVLWENEKPFHPLWQSETLGFVVTENQYDPRPSARTISEFHTVAVHCWTRYATLHKPTASNSVFP